MKAVFSLDVSIASLLLLVTTATLFTFYSFHVSTTLSRFQVAEKERLAIQAADFLLSACAEDGGLLACDAAFRYSHTLSPHHSILRANQTLSFLHRHLQTNHSLSLRLLDVEDRILASANASASSNNVCVRRLALLQKQVVVLEVCVS